MGFGATSKGGGGSGNAGGGKRKQGRGGKKPKSRSFKVKGGEGIAAATPATTPTAFTVQPPNSEERARLLATRRHGERILTAANDRRRRPVNGTSTSGRVLGGNAPGSAVLLDDVIIGTTNNQQQEQQQTQRSQTEQEVRQAFIATQEAKTETARRHREQVIKAKRRDEEQRFSPKIALAKQQWDTLVARLGGDREGGELLEKIRTLLKVVLRNSATKSDPKYKRLNAQNYNLWMRLLQFQEVVVILLEGAGFERRTVGNNDKKETEAVRIEIERDRINLELSQALDYNPSAIASLVADLDALEIAALGHQQKPAAVCGKDNVSKARDFELCHAGAGEDGLGMKRILALLRAVRTW